MFRLLGPYGIAAIVIAWGLSAAWAFFYGMRIGVEREENAQAQEERIAAVATAAAASAAANAISQIKVTHTTVNRKLEKEIYEKPVFRDCRSGPNAVELFNSAIPADPAGSKSDRGVLPTKNADR